METARCNTTWEHAPFIFSILIRELHASRTMVGKKRKHPLKRGQTLFEKAEKVRQNRGTHTGRNNKKLPENSYDKTTNNQVESNVNI